MTPPEAPPLRGRDGRGKVLAVIPAHNEAGRIGAVVRGTSRFLPVLVVDDGSRDATGDQAAEAGARVLSQSPNRGKGAALKAGFAAALAEDWEALLTLDADGQHDPSEIPRFLLTWEEQGADLVVGARSFAKMPPQRTLTNTVARWIFSWAVGEAVADNQSGYRLLSRRLVEAVMESPEEGFAFEVDVIAECIGQGWPIAWIPIRTIYGDQTSHITPWAHLTGFLRAAGRARRRVRDRRKQRKPDGASPTP